MTKQRMIDDRKNANISPWIIQNRNNDNYYT